MTVNGNQAVVGPELTYVAVPKARDLHVVADRGTDVVLGLTLAEGVTEAFVAWQRDGDHPHSASTPVANGSGSLRVTNTKLDIDGGVAVPAPDDGRGLYVVVYPAMRVGGELVPAQNGPALLARQPRQIVVAYEVERAELLRRKVHVNVHMRDESAVPALEVQAVSASGSRRTLETIAGSMPSTQRALPADSFGGNAVWTVEVVSTAPRGFAVSVEHPELDARRVTP